MSAGRESMRSLSAHCGALGRAMTRLSIGRTNAAMRLVLMRLVPMRARVVVAVAVSA